MDIDNSNHQSNFSFDEDFVDYLPVGIIITNNKGKILKVNNTASTYFNKPLKQILNMKIEEIQDFTNEAKKRIIETRKKIIKENKLLSFDTQINDWSKLKVFVDRYNRPKGKDHIIYTLIDNTSEKDKEQELKKNLHRMEFFNNLLSHDINNINQVTQGYLELLLEDLKFNKKNQLSKKQQEYLKNSLYQIKESASLIEDIRNFNEINLNNRRLKKLNIDKYLDISIENIIEQFSSFNLKIEKQNTTNKKYTLAEENLTELFYHIFYNSIIFMTNKQKKIVIKLESKIIDNTHYWLYKIIVFGAHFPNEVIKYLKQNQLITNDEDFDDTFIRIMERNNTYNNRIGLRFTIINRLASRYKTKLWIEDSIDDNGLTGSCIAINLAFPKK